MIVRVYSGDDGESHFEDIDLEYQWNEKVGSGLTGTVESEGVNFRHHPPGLFMDFHNAPRRQYVVGLAGQAEVVIGSGEKRIFGPGDVMLAEDLTGHGHTTRVIGDQPRVSMYALLPNP